MYCFQCEEAAKGCGCTVKGVCGKDEQTAELQDVLIYILKGISKRNIKAIANGKGNKDAGIFIAESLFATLTNVNFDKERFRELINEGILIRDSIPPADEIEHDACTWLPQSDEDIKSKAGMVSVLATENEDVRSLRELLVYGLKGVGAYYYHAAILGYEDEEITTFIQEALASTLNDLTVEEMVANVLKCGEIGVKTLALLDTANTTAYGNPEITKVSTKPKNRPGILVTGHDLKDLEELLLQSVGSGVDIYTHGEMLPAHAYPAFKKYDHLIGNYGGSWPFQKEEFESFNGPVLVTTNCLVPPKDSYSDKVYTTGPVGFSGLRHIGTSENGGKDFSLIIEHAKKCQPPKDLNLKDEGFIKGLFRKKDEGEKDLITGCAHEAVLSIVDKVVDAVKAGSIKRFVVMAGCDGRHSERDYYSDFAKALPKDTVILTAGCAKYRYNSLPLGDIEGIPRVIDAGQCNDSYSLVVIAMALAKAFDVELNDLPISYNIAWYEQKAVLVLLSLLHLGIKDITLGPRLPAFVSPGVLKVLVENFGIRKNSTVEEDLKLMVPE
ncbi:hydroxylamine reductase [Methanoplanus sp. FWC-SCC4]|uniref:Hydroxylamine reductase n=1 Tax=Methanochimaera problematica TaxID=2609417 RepID=A0AA97FFX4_9EURY|nr:hydroxylamine reductase [Methanoplanus sp. FWC-SCC4]WOF17288.1 hydroxylamine reductase [Methanoplanus sp. FWC-SCC4]